MHYRQVEEKNPYFPKILNFPSYLRKKYPWMVGYIFFNNRALLFQFEKTINVFSKNLKFTFHTYTI